MNNNQEMNKKKLLATLIIMVFFFIVYSSTLEKHTTNAWYTDSSDLLQRYLVYDHYGIVAFSVNEESEFEIFEQDNSNEKNSSEPGVEKFGQGLPVEEQKEEDKNSEEDNEENDEDTDDPQEIENEDQENEEYEDDRTEDHDNGDADIDVNSDIEGQKEEN